MPLFYTILLACYVKKASEMYRMVKMMAARPDHGVGRGAITVNESTAVVRKKKKKIKKKKNH